MINASDLLKKVQAEFNCKKTIFYKRKKELESLGYKLEPKKQGRVSFYSDEQYAIIFDYLSYINKGGISNEYPAKKQNSIVKNSNYKIEKQKEDLDTFPQENESKIVDNKAKIINDGVKLIDNEAKRVDEESQLEAARREIMVDYYRATGQYNIPGLSTNVENAKEKIHQGKVMRELERITNLIPD